MNNINNIHKKAIMDALSLTLSNYISNYAQRRFELDYSTSQMVSMLTLTVFSKLQTMEVNWTIYDKFISQLTYLNAILLIICVISYKLYFKITIFNAKKKYKCITIVDNPYFLRKLNRYMVINHAYFKTDNVDFKEIYMKGYEISYIDIYTDKINFTDALFNITGYLEFKEIVQENSEQVGDKLIRKNKEYVSVSIFVLVTENLSKLHYKTHIENFIKKYDMNSNIKNLNYYKFCKSSFVKMNFYHGTITELEEENKVIYETYFSQYKYIIDSFMSTPLTYNNILLYGPPGVGKSKIVYVCARFLQCNIYNIDLSLYMNDKSLLFKIFSGMDFTLPIKKGDENAFCGTFSSSNKCIILLEEVDYAIEKIIENSKKPVEHVIQPTATDAATDAMINKILHDEEDKLELSDLLELFQGSVPTPNRIIIANTNNLSKINNLIPALLRPGRLTPIFMDYITWEILNEITIYHYNQLLTCKPIKICIPTSQIIEEITLYKQQKKSFEEFQNHLIRLLQNA